MATIIKLLIAALILHGVYRLGTAYWERYEFEDAVQRTVQFAEKAPPEEIKKSVLELAAEREIPVVPEAVSVTRRQRQVFVTAEYDRDVELLPRYYRTFTFEIDVSVLSVN
jgi:hypothetical protein